MLDPFEKYSFPVDIWVQNGIDWFTLYFRPFFRAIRWPIAHTLDGVEAFLIVFPPLIFLILLLLIAWQIAGLRVAVFTVLGMTFLGFIGVWKATMTTIALIVTSVLFCVTIGIPLGIWAARSNRVDAFTRPILDAMQTCPGFVYLVPIVMLIGIGNVAGVAVTIVFALPPVIRLTNLGIRQVPEEVVEAARAFGSSPLQILLKVQLPLAIRSIMLGVNQTLMMALSMVVIASMIAVDGLGMLVLRGIGRLDMGLATVGGVGIIVLAMILDRVTQAVGRPGTETVRWTERGPVGLALSVGRNLSNNGRIALR